MITLNKNFYNKTFAAIILTTSSVAAMAANSTDINEQYTAGNSLPYYNASNYTYHLNNYTYLGVKGGTASVDTDKSPKFDNATVYGLYSGVSFANNFGLELEYTMSEDVDVTSTSFGDGQYSVSNYGGFITYDYPLANSLYLKSKLGIGGVDVTEQYHHTDRSVNDIGVAGGMRLGYKFTESFVIEGEYNMFNSKEVGVDSITLGALYQF